MINELQQSLTNKISEDNARKKLYAYLKSLGQWNIDENVAGLMDVAGGYDDRFNYFMPFISDGLKARLLISGCSVGSELIVAKKFGFSKIFGTEVTQEYVAIAKERLKQDTTFQIDYYDGIRLPYSDSYFTMICSGHIIEHTTSPFRYLCEHLRVLSPKGIMFLEFPNRYNFIELHTNISPFIRKTKPL